MTSIPIKRALLSVSDKTGIVDLGTALASHGVELVSTGGTATALRAAEALVADGAKVIVTGRHEDTVEQAVRELGGDAASGVVADNADPATAERVDFDFQAGQDLGVQGTPTIFVNDEAIDLQRLDDIKAALDAALAS